MIFKGNASNAKGMREEMKMEIKDKKSEVLKPEKKLKGDFGFDCHYCNGVNHMASDCMLRKREEKK